MSFWTAIVTIIAIVFLADIIAKFMKAKSSSRKDDAELEAALKQVEELEKRIRVLERIVTENKFDLKNEINKL